MCMKYVNTITNCFKSVSKENNCIVSFNAPFESIIATIKDGQSSINDFVVLTLVNILGTGDESKIVDNPLSNKKTIDFIIRLTKCDANEENRIGYDLDRFSINLADMDEKKQIDHACFEFFNYTRMTNVDHIPLQGGVGKYVIKVLIKDSEQEEYTIQSMTKLTIIE